MGMNPQSVHQTKNKGEWLENERIQFKIQSRKAVDLAVKNLEFPDIPTKMTRLLLTVTNFESSMPFTQEEMDFCLSLKQAKMRVWKSNPPPINSVNANQIENGGPAQNEETATTRFIDLFNNFDMFKRYYNI